MREAVIPGVKALKDHWPPLLMIQIGAVLLVIFFYRSAWLQSESSSLSELKVKGGSIFAFVGGALAGGIFPEMAKLLTGRLAKLDGQWVKDFIFNSFVYGVVGVEVELFYRYQTTLWGGGNSLETLIKKTCTDEFVFTPTLAIPTAMYLYEWKNQEFNSKKFLNRISHHYYRSKVLPSLVIAWGFWIPVLFCIYAMPTTLQYSFSLLAEAAWSILFVFLATKEPVVTVP